MPRSSWEWFDNIEKLFHRDEITEQQYLDGMDKLKKTIKDWVDKVKTHVFGVKYPKYDYWLRKTTAKTSAYKKRIIRYMEKHPAATLSEARGHGKKR